jgi:predicted amidohydrolase
MTKSVYRTAQGKMIDMGALRLQNERVRAVGNMKVNARGDVIDDRGAVVTSKPNQVNRHYNRTHKKP